VKLATVGCLSFRGGFLFAMSKVVLGQMLERLKSSSTEKLFLFLIQILDIDINFNIVLMLY